MIQDKKRPVPIGTGLVERGEPLRGSFGKPKFRYPLIPYICLGDTIQRLIHTLEVKSHGSKCMPKVPLQEEEAQEEVGIG